MKIVLTLSLVTCSLAVALATSFAADSKVAAPATKPTTSTAWRPLFNGKDLIGWKVEGKAHWRVEDGVILGTQDGDARLGGLLATTDKFRDFELELEFMIDEHGKYNSGVYLRNDPGTAGRTGYQVNIGRSPAEEYFAGVYTYHSLAT